mgnify:CR=1 FL=1
MFEFSLGKEPQSQGSSGGLYDVVIIGSGPAGLTSAIYTSRDGLKTLVLEKATAGGLVATTELVENYPGFPEGVAGSELMELFHKQAERFGTEVVEFEEVEQVEPVEPGLIKVHTGAGEVYEGKTLIVATGSESKKLGVPGEKEFYGRGVSYCATCDGPLFRGKDVVIVGAGNSGLQEGSIMLGYVKSLTIVEFLPTSKAEKILQDRVFGHEKTTLHFNHMLTEIKGEKVATGVVVKDRETGEEREIPTDGVFIYVGYAPYTQFLSGLLELNRFGYIVTDTHTRTSVPGIFAAGDVRADNLAQIAVAVGDGAKAAVAVREYLLEL